MKKKSRHDLVGTTHRLPDGSLEVEVSPRVECVRVVSKDKDGVRHIGLRSEKALREYFDVPASYRTVVFKPNQWPQQDGEGPFVANQAKGTFQPPKAEESAVEGLIHELRKKSPRVPKLKRGRGRPAKDRTMLEISLVDLHFGMLTFKGASDADYDMDKAAQLYLWAVEELLHAASGYEIEKILFPIGNDYMHVDGPEHTTTRGTPQAEMAFYHEAFERGMRLLIATIDRLKEIAPVHMVVIPGNHDETTAIHMGYVMDAYYHNDANVTVDAGPDPQKYVEYGVNLIGFEHGNGGKQVRMAALMAQARPDAWARTVYREWHMGDQHRKGVFEEQGVSMEFLPSLVPANWWHKKNTFNNQKRGAMAFVWSQRRGPVARLQVNLNSYTGRPLE
jgi:hypothetical protein